MTRFRGQTQDEREKTNRPNQEADEHRKRNAAEQTQAQIVEALQRAGPLMLTDAVDKSDGKHPGGRPPKYQSAFATQAAKLCELGATDEDLADFFEVSVRTIARWKVEHAEFCHALKLGKAEADDRVEHSLYQKAVGYTFDSEKVFQHQGEIVRAPVREHLAPDTTACIFWLKNRKPQQWRDNQQIEHTGKDGGPIQIDDREAGRRIAFALARAQQNKPADKPKDQE